MIRSNMKFFSFASALLIAAIPAAAIDISINPGEFRHDLNDIISSGDSKVTLRGSMSAEDIALLKKLPATVKNLDMSGVVLSEIPAYMLVGSSVEQFVFPAEAASIGESAFAGAALTSVSIPATVISIGNNAFGDSPKLASVSFAGNPELGNGVFRHCPKLMSVQLGEGISIIPASTFEGCSSLDMAIPATVTEIGDRAFYGTSLRTAALHSVSSIGDYAFAAIPTLGEVTLGKEDLRHVGVGAFFFDKGLAELPQSNSEGAPALFASYVSAPANAIVSGATIGEGAYANNSGVTRIILDSDVKKIESHAFRNASHLTEIEAGRLGANIPELDHEAFSGLEDADGDYKHIYLLTTRVSMNQWAAHPEWGRFSIAQSSVLEEIADLGEIHVSARRSGDVIEVSSTMPIDRLEVFSVSGMKLHDSAPRIETARIEGVVAGQAAIVRVSTGDIIKIIKLL